MSILTEYLKGKEERSKIIADYYKGEEDLKESYYESIGKLEKELRMLRSKKDVEILKYLENENYENNERFKELRWEEEKLYATLYCKFFQLKGMKSVSPLKMHRLVKEDEEGIIHFNKLVDTDYCKLYYEHSSMDGKKYIKIVGSCLIPSKTVLLLGLCNEYFHFKGIKGLDKENLPKVLIPDKSLYKCPVNVYGMNWYLNPRISEKGEIANNFSMSIPYSKSKGMPKFKLCQEISSVISEINEKFYMDYWFKAEKMKESLYKELIKDLAIQRHLDDYSIYFGISEEF